MVQARILGRRRTTVFTLVFLVAGLVLTDVGQRPAEAAVTAVKGSACGYFTIVGLFGGPPARRGCGQPPGPPATAASPFVTLPAGGSETPVTLTDHDGATAQYGPARIFSGIWPAGVSSAPPSGPITVTTQGTPSDGSVTSSADIVLRDPPDADWPGGFGPGPVEGEELHATCTATETDVTGSATFVKGLLSTTTDPEGSPKAQERIPDNPPVNYTRSGVITNVGDVFTVVFNEQIVNPDGSLTVNAVHMYLFGPTAVGEQVIGQVTCGTTPSTVSPSDTVAPTCGMPVIKPVGPADPTPLVPRQELVGVFDAGGLQSITEIQVTNGTVQVGDPSSLHSYLNFVPGQKGPLPVTAVRSDESKPMVWSFKATDVAGNVTVCQGIEPPRVSGLFPDVGPLEDGNQVVITGTGFSDATAVNFGPTPATAYTVDSDTQITAIAPARETPGMVDVSVTTPRGTLTTAEGEGYTYDGEAPPPTTTAPTTTSPPSNTTTTSPPGSATTVPTAPSSTTQAGGGSSSSATTQPASAGGGGTAAAAGGATSGGASGGQSATGGSSSAPQRGTLSKTGFPFPLQPLVLLAIVSLALGAVLAGRGGRIDQ